jgi:putative tricarboxylic transport membrane protein
MNYLKQHRTQLISCFATALLGWLSFPAALFAQDWKPTRSVEYIVPSGPGAALDTAARKLANLLEQNKFVSDPIIVANRSGGAGTIALQTLLQHKGDGHWVATFTTGMINARAIGEVSTTYLDATPIAVFLEESIVVAVRADSQVKDANNLVATLKNEPDGLSIGIATAVGNHIHVGIAKPLQTAGVDVSRLRMVPFRSSADSMTALLGGHVDVVAASTPNVIAQLQAGKIRVLAVASAERMPGALSSVPTWTEQGIPVVYSSIQGLLGPKDISPAQVRFWENAVRRATETEEWQDFINRQNWRPMFLGAEEMKHYIEREYTVTKQLMNDLKLSRQ